MEIIQEILFKEGQGPPNAVLIEFGNYAGPAIVTSEGKKLVPIVPTYTTNIGSKISNLFMPATSYLSRMGDNSS